MSFLRNLLVYCCAEYTRRFLTFITFIFYILKTYRNDDSGGGKSQMLFTHPFFLSTTASNSSS